MIMVIIGSNDRLWNVYDSKSAGGLLAFLVLSNP